MVITGIRDGLTYPGKVPEADGMTFEWCNSAPLLLITLDRPSPSEIYGVRFGTVKAGVLNENPVTALYFRFDSLEGDAYFHAGLYSQQFLAEYPESTSLESRLVVDVVLVDRSSKRVRAIRALTFSQAQTLLLCTKAKQHTSNPITRAEYEHWVADYMRRYPTPAAMRPTLEAFGKLGI